MMGRRSRKRLLSIKRPLQRCWLLLLIFCGIIMVFTVLGTHTAYQSNIRNCNPTPVADLHASGNQTSNLPADRAILPSIVHSDRNMVTHVRFLKVHKAGSTTIQNLLFRFGLRHDLDFLLPQEGNYLWPATAHVPLPAANHYDIFAIHTVYNKDWFDKMLPKESVNIGIVRRPTSRLISAAYYYRDKFQEPHLLAVPKKNFIHALVQHPELYEKPMFSRTRNAMGRDFGFPWDLSPNDTEKIKAYLRLLDKEFILVMIMERFEESLVLLKRLLNWSLIDILYRHANSYRYESVHLENWEIAKLKKTCFLDFALYDYFRKRFDEHVNKAGPDFYDEVMYFNQTLENVETFCKAHLGKTFTIEASPWNKQLTLSSSECLLMRTTSETKFIENLKERHLKRYPGVLVNQSVTADKTEASNA